MRFKHLLSLFSFLFLYQWAQAQQMKPADPALRGRLAKYAADNHLSPGNKYMYFDTATKLPIRFVAGSFLVEDHSPRTSGNRVLPGKGTAPSVLDAAGNFHLVKDINSSTNSDPSIDRYFSPPNQQQYAVLNGVAYFSADDGIHGAELWRSDGTAAGTYLVKDVVPGETGSDPSYLFALAGKLYFSFYNYDLSDYELWTSDGTAGNTVQITPAGNPFYTSPNNFCEVNGTVYFTSTGLGGTFNEVLWKTDGTTAGTSVVKDYNGTYSFPLQNLVAANNLLFFTTYNNSYGRFDLLRCDGTDAGTYVLYSYPYTGSNSGISQLTAYNNQLYFQANEGNAFGSSLWVTDGTTSGTGHANGLNGVQLYSYGFDFFGPSQSFLVSNNVLYFPGYTSSTGWELYKYDAASGDGIVLVKDITPGSNGYVIPYTTLADVNGTVYFGYTDTIPHLYKTNGTEASTVLVKDLPGAGPDKFYSGNGKLYFNLTTSAHGAEPWTSDGTTSGTMELADVYGGTVSSNPDHYTPLSAGVLFSATGAASGSEVYITGGSGAALLKDINTTATAGSYVDFMSPLGDGVITRAYTYENGYQPWNATSSDASLIEVVNSQSSGYPYNFRPKNGFSYFIINIADSSAYSYAIYKTDGTSAGTVEMTPTLNGYSGWGYTVTDDNTLYYIVQNGSVIGGSNTTYELWKTDGTTAGNVKLHSFTSLGYTNDSKTGSSYVMISIGNTVYIAAGDGNAGSALWKTDGTVAGTVLVKNVPTNSSLGPQLTAFNNQLYFVSYDYNSGYGLWVSDGTESGTVELAGATSISQLTDGGSNLYFSAYTTRYGEELWKTDGTAAGTSIVKDIISGDGSSMPSLLTNVNGILFFNIRDSVYNVQLWKTDGTNQGTIPVAVLGNTYININSAVADGKLFFLSNRQLWVSDGTSAGTGQVMDAVLEGIESYNVVANGNQIFLASYNYKYGTELYAGDAMLSALPVTLTSFGASLKGTDVLAQWQTASETNTSYFNVQRSTDGIHFTDAGKIMAKGSGSTYSFTDVNIANLISAKTLYYRLQTVDKDGSNSLSKVVPVTLNLKEAAVLLLPNPVKDVLTIRINNYTGKADICVFDANGKMVSCSQKAMQSGGDVMLNASSLQSGIYLVKISLDGKIIQQKFMKQ